VEHAGTRCDSLDLNGKEGVDGSSPSEGSAKAPQSEAFCDKRISFLLEDTPDDPLRAREALFRNVLVNMAHFPACISTGSPSSTGDVIRSLPRARVFYRSPR
jgi:hypothetical protein